MIERIGTAQRSRALRKINAFVRGSSALAVLQQQTRVGTELI